ncbi:MAG: SGNH/GDSL hydrolase family protein [bacterium]
MKRILFLGNSITNHAPKPDIGWDGNWGMAASAIEKDYVHLLLQRITNYDGVEPVAQIENIADFEREYATFDITGKFKSYANFNADIIVLAIGENVPGLETEDDKINFSNAITALLTLLLKGNSPTLLVRSTFWADPVKDAILQQKCFEAGGTFVDISGLCKNELNFARSERDYEHAGVAAHPGDAGMAAIADAIFNELKINN